MEERGQRIKRKNQADERKENMKTNENNKSEQHIV